MRARQRERTGSTERRTQQTGATLNRGRLRGDSATPLGLLDLLRFAGREPDEPRLAPGVQLLDLQVESRALGSTTTARIVFPAKTLPAARLPVVYLLHEERGSFRSWTNHSGVTDFVAEGMVLVMPDASGTCFIDDMHGWSGYYEHFLNTELPSALLRRLPLASGERAQTAIVGVGRGGFGAVVLALKHPRRFGFAGALSAPLNLATQGFRWQTPLDSLALRRTFGPADSSVRRANDPAALGSEIPPAQAPLFWLSSGRREPGLAASQRFATLLQQRGLPYTWNKLPRGHGWPLWDAQLPELGSALGRFFSGCGGRCDRPQTAPDAEAER